jgi:tRNA(Ile)-lysidine synthase
MDLSYLFKNSINKFISPDDKIIMAISGGPDSVAMLYLFNSIKQEYGLKLYAAHFNHKLRGSASDRDEKFVRNLCLKLSIPYFCAKKDIKKMSEKLGGGIEKNAREARYGFLVKCAQKTGAQKIAVAHNLDDNAETVLMRLITGAGASGLSGIAGMREIHPGEFGMKNGKTPRKVIIIRPLLNLKKMAILEFLKTNNIKFVIDKSNFSNVYTRNLMRNRLIPSIEKQLNPNFKNALAAAGEVLALESDFMENEAKKIYRTISSEKKGQVTLKITELKKVHPALARRVLRLALKSVFISKRRAGFDAVIKAEECLQTGIKKQLPENCECYAASGLLTITVRPQKAVNRAVKLFKLPEKNIEYSGYKFTFEVLENNFQPDFSDRNSAYLDLARIKFPIVIRERKKGDKFIPYGMTEMVRLKKFLNTSGSRKDPVLVVSKNWILWAAGCRIDERAKITSSTKKILHIIQTV